MVGVWAALRRRHYGEDGGDARHKNDDMATSDGALRGRHVARSGVEAKGVVEG